jgi:branched-chain amino acid transport system substrate-binding protein
VIKIRFLLVLSFIIHLTVGSVFAQEETTADCNADDPVVFGFIVDNTGIGVIFAESQFKGIDMAMEDLNANGGILGRCAEYIWQDAALDASQAATLAEQFVLEDGVEFLVGGTSSGAALAITEVARENAVPVVFHTSNTVQLTTTHFHPYMVQVVPHTTIEARAAAAFAAQEGFTVWASIGPDYAFGRDSFNAFQPHLVELNPDADIRTQQWPALGEADLGPYISAIQAFGPEAVYSSLWGDQLVNFITLAIDLGLFDDEVAIFGLLDTDVLKALGDELPEGIYGYARAPFYAIDTPQMDDFNTRFFERYEEYPSDWAIMIYDGVFALAAAAEAADSTEGDAVATALDDLTFTALRGDLTIRACDHMANVGEYVGISSQESEYGIPILRDTTYVPAEDVWNTCEEIEAMRAEAAG